MSTEDYSFIDNEFIEIDDSVGKWAKYHKKVALNIRNTPAFGETVYDGSFKIYEKYNIILDILLKKPELNIMDIYLEKQNGKKHIKNENQEEPWIDDNEYKKIRRKIEDLQKLLFIEKLPDKKTKVGNFEKVHSVPFRLSLCGIFYIIMNYILYRDVWYVLKYLLKNYSDNILFQYFLYPYFDKSTLKESILYPVIIDYLKEVCPLIKYHLSGIGKVENLVEGYVTTPVFTWASQKRTAVPSSSIHQENWSSLKEYLDEEMGWKWIYKARIIPDYSKNVISIQSNEVTGSPIIFINREEKKTILKFNGVNYNIFGVDESYGEFRILKKFVKEKDLRSDSFKNGLLKQHVLLLTNMHIQGNNIMTNNIKIFSKILSTDEKFVNLTNKITSLLQEEIKK